MFICGVFSLLDRMMGQPFAQLLGGIPVSEAVRSALVSQGVGNERLSTMGYGEAFPVAGNESAGGRQMNRRVEIVLSDDGGVVAPR